MAEESRRKRCEVLLDIQTFLRELEKKSEYRDPDKKFFLDALRTSVSQLLEMCRME
jgi:hypothetical protein